MYVNVEIEEWEVLSHLSDKDLLDEIYSRDIDTINGASIRESLLLLEQIYQEQRKLGNSSQAMKDLMYSVLGKVL